MKTNKPTLVLTDIEKSSTGNIIKFIIDNFPGVLYTVSIGDEIVTDEEIENIVIRLLSRLKDLEAALDKLGIKL